MANEQVSQFTELAEGPAIADLFGVVDVSDTTDAASGTTKRNKAQYALGSQVNPQTGTTYTYLTTDFRKLVTHTNASAIAGTLPQAGASFPAGWFMFVQNRGAGALTITPTTSTIDGAATLVLNQNQAALIVSDGTNYAALKFIADAGAPAAHASDHENGGSDEIDVTGLSGVLADAQVADKVVETSGPTTLDIGDIVDGEFLKRVGGEIVSDSVPGGAEAGANSDITSMDGLTGALESPTRVTVAEVAAPSTPPTGFVHIYAKSDGKLYIKDDAGTETDLAGGGGSITPLVIESANVVAQRNGVNAQSLLLYGIFTDASNYERLSISRNGTNFVIGTEALGSGSVRQLQLGFGATRRLHFSATEFTPDANNVLNLGSGSLRWASLRAVNTWAQSAFILEGGTEITDAGNASDGVVKLGKLGGEDGTWTGGGAATINIGSSNLNNYNFITNAHMQRWSSGAAIDITGMTRTQVQGQTHLIVNVGSNNFTLKHEDGASTAANRFLNSTGADIVLSANQAADVIYDATSQRWRAFKRN